MHDITQMNMRDIAIYIVITDFSGLFPWISKGCYGSKYMCKISDTNTR